MEESGYAEGISSVLCSSDENVRISGGSVECPVEKDGTLLLSTLQAQFPCAAGLSYMHQENKNKRAIRYDVHSGKLYPPPDGWNDREYCVSFCLAITSAEKISEQSVIDELKEELVTLRRNKEQQHEQISRTHEELEKLTKERDEYQEKVREYETELVAKVSELEGLYCQRQAAQDLEAQTKYQYEGEVGDLKNQINDFYTKEGDLNQQLDKLTEESNLKQQRIDELEWLKNELDANRTQEIDALKHELQLSHTRIGELEEEKKRVLDEAEQVQAPDLGQDLQETLHRVQELETSTAITVDEHHRALDEAQNHIKRQEEELQTLRQLLDDKSSELDITRSSDQEHVQRLEVELSEVRQWFNDTKWRCGELEAGLGQKEADLNNASQELHTLKEQLDLSHNRVQELETSGAGKEEEYQKLLEDAQNQTRSKEDELSGLKQQLEEKKSSDEALRVKANDLSQRKAELKAENLSLKEQNVNLKKKISAMGTGEETMQKLESELAEVKQWYNDTKWRCGELEASLGEKEAELQSRSDQFQHLDWEINKARRELEEAQERFAEMDRACRDKDAHIYTLESKIQTAEVQTISVEQMMSASTGAVDELTDELKMAHQKKFELEAQLSSMNADFKQAQIQSVELHEEVKRLAEELRQTYERMQHLEGSTGHLEWEKGEVVGQLHDAGGRIHWLEGELGGLWQKHRDLEWHCGELQGFKDKVYRYLPDSFMVRKEPFVDRDRWDLAMWSEHKVENFVRVWFELDAPWAKHVYLVGSFFNWECALLCTWHEHNRWGVWVDLPRGRHEFRFIADGQWVTSDQFGKIPNDFGSENNWRQID